MTPRTIVTVGAGQAAAVAARNLRRQGFDGRIMLIGDEPHAPYQRPPLSKEFLAGTDTEAALWILRPSWIADNDVEILTGTSVLRVEPASRTVAVDSGADIEADAVLFATGGTPRTLTVPGPRPDLVHYLRTLDDALRLAPVLVPGRRLAIIGAGFIGLEIAATAAAAGVSVTVFESVPVPLARILGSAMGEAVCRLHRDHGVDLRTGVRLAGIWTTADGVLIDIAGAAEPFEADAVVIGIGITPNTTVAEASGLGVDDGIVVDASGRTSIPGIFAAGDVARRYSERAGRHVRLEHFDNASRQGVAVSNAILGRDMPSDDAPWFWSDQHGHNLQFIGAATGDPVIRGDIGARDFTGFYLEGATVRGAFAVDRGEDIMAARELLGREVEVAALRDESTDLWDLAYADIDEESQVQQ
ncbi:NAD(P)/FAD-dependent oxidoreductase [Mycolicibacterium fluoranthenivorans]|uniref:3-phenylpropionate/trans-cinnamate dioxygenase ferredoxin reductase subunit n=1 Tax=Mycolicibacterium fluoranthenivorans TaxID=258505 RepID=A0A7X5TX69_9MYCO|nr:FAD-dependent oxidoreductase [Mycolicibacterium fluoranthenivorans]MCV7356984.1 FAD-dependent oxidoreductase [Mycolicibacterium fluoranthenivorans]NIH94382.1 3-phenylpropionate/trans-cinnamate dioxygenase ferredoxin reductase subunit [Mycolicibacterium fluoranthenivorans]